MTQRSLRVFLCVCFATGFLASASVAKDVTDYRPRPTFIELPQPAANPPEIGIPMRQAAASDTTLLGWWQFETPAGVPDEQGWTKIDKTAQEKTYFHIDGPACSDITAVSGVKSMWCGQRPSSADPWCGWAALPGYGGSWDQSLVTPEIAMPASMTYTAVWDSEPGYDRTFVEYWDDANEQWVEISTVNGGQGSYDGAGGPIVETVSAAATTTTRFRFHFASDGAWDDRDGLSPSDEGAIKVDDITTTYGAGPTIAFEDFEDESCDALVSNDGFWTAEPAPGYGIFAHLTSGASVIQEDPCRRPISFLWAFFDDPLVTNYECGGFPHQGAMPYGPNENGLYLDNEIWSPWVPLTGSGDEYRLEFLTYRDLPLDNLQCYKYHIRTRGLDGCAGQWDDYASDFYYGGQKDWHRFTLNISSLIASGAVDVQVAVGAWDACRWYCGIYGTGACHSHAPLIDQVRVSRIDVQGPQWNVRHIDLWQDNFPEEGGVDPATGYTRCDMAQDILPSLNGSILPGDSIAVEATDPNGFAVDNTGGRPGVAIYAFVKVTDRFGNPKAGKSGTAIQSPDNQGYSGDSNAGSPSVAACCRSGADRMGCVQDGPVLHTQWRCGGRPVLLRPHGSGIRRDRSALQPCEREHGG